MAGVSIDGVRLVDTVTLVDSGRLIGLWWKIG
jgi:hypothetical protein